MDVTAILETLETHKLIRLNRQMDDWYSVFCPFHNNGQERRPSCGVSMHQQIRAGSVYDEGFWHCFACGASYPMERGVDIILKNHGITSISGTEWLVKNVPGYEVNSDFEYLVLEDTMKVLASKYSVDQIKILESKQTAYVSEEELASYRFVVPYMYERKLTDKIIEDYDIGYDAKWIPPGRKKPVPCITIPIRDKDGRTLFFCRRSIKGKIYNYPEGVTKPVFGIDMVQTDTPSVIICESAINALTAVSYGYKAVALLGTGNQYQIQQLKEMGVPEFVICMDGDEAGHKATAKLKKYLKSVALVWSIQMPDGKDLNDCSKEEFDKLYASRE